MFDKELVKDILVSVHGFTVQRFKVDKKFQPRIPTIALYDMNYHA